MLECPDGDGLCLFSLLRLPWKQVVKAPLADQKQLRRWSIDSKLCSASLSRIDCSSPDTRHVLRKSQRRKEGPLFKNARCGKEKKCLPPAFCFFAWDTIEALHFWGVQTVHDFGTHLVKKEVYVRASVCSGVLGALEAAGKTSGEKEAKTKTLRETSQARCRWKLSLPCLVLSVTHTTPPHGQTVDTCTEDCVRNAEAPGRCRLLARATTVASCFVTSLDPPAPVLQGTPRRTHMLFSRAGSGNTHTEPRPWLIDVAFTTPRSHASLDAIYPLT